MSYFALPYIPVDEQNLMIDPKVADYCGSDVIWSAETSLCET